MRQRRSFDTKGFTVQSGDFWRKLKVPESFIEKYAEYRLGGFCFSSTSGRMSEYSKKKEGFVFYLLLCFAVAASWSFLLIRWLTCPNRAGMFGFRWAAMRRSSPPAPSSRNTVMQARCCSKEYTDRNKIRMWTRRRIKKKDIWEEAGKCIRQRKDKYVRLS